MNYVQQVYYLLNIINMKTIYKYYYLFSITFILYLITLLKYEINCMEEIQDGKGHFLVWIVRGYTSLSYQVDIIKLIIDFLLSFLIILLFERFIRFKMHRYIKIIINISAFLIILTVLSFLFIGEVYFEKINCEVIYSSLSIDW